MSEESDEISIDVEMHGALAEDAAAASHEAEALAKNLKAVNRALLAQQKLLKSNRDALLEMAGAEKTASEEADKHTTATGKGTKATSDFEKETEKATDSVKKFTAAKKNDTNVFKSFSTVATKTGKVLQVVGKTLFTTVKLLGMAGLAGVAAYAVQWVIALVQELSSLSAFLALMPLAIGTMIAVFGTLKVATMGVSTAIQALAKGDASALEKALKKLSPAARTFVLTIKQFVPQFKKLKSQVQEAFFEPIDDNFKTMLSKDLPIVKQGMTTIASTFGVGIAQIEKYLGSVGGQNTLSDIFDFGTRAAFAFENAAAPILKGIGSIIDALAPKFDDLIDKSGTLGEKFGAWMTKIATNGQLVKWFDNAEATASKLWSVIKLVVSLFKDLSTAAGPSGLGNSLGLLIRGLSFVDQFLGSIAGKKVVSALFQGLEGILKAVAPLFEVIANILITDVIPSLMNIITGLAPGVTAFFSALGDALKILMPYWKPLATAVGGFLAVLDPLLPVIGQLLAIMAQYLVVVLTGWATVLVPLLKALAGPLSVFLGFLSQLMQAVMPYILKDFQAFANALTPLAPVLAIVGKELGTQLASIIPQIIPLLEQMTPLISALAGQLGMALVEALEELIPQLPVIVQAFLYLLNVILKNRGPLMALILMFLELVPTIIKVIPVIAYLIVMSLRMAATFGKILGEIIRFVEPGVALLFKFGGVVVKVFGAILAPMKKPFSAIVSFVSGVVNTIIGYLEKIPGKISSILKQVKSLPSEALSGLGKLNPFKFAGGPVDAGTKYTVGEIGKELFVPNNGQRPYMIGRNGMETRSFANSGVIVPNHMLGLYEKMQKSQAKAATKMTSGHTGAPQQVVSSHNYNVHVQVNGNVDEEVDIERAVRKGINKADRDRRERETGAKVAGALVGGGF